MNLRFYYYLSKCDCDDSSTRCNLARTRYKSKSAEASLAPSGTQIPSGFGVTRMDVQASNGPLP